MAEKESGVVVRRPEARRLVWDPWAEFDEVRRHFDGLLNRTFGTLPWGRAFAPAEASYEPPVELVETADEMLLNVYVPGLPQDKITLEVEPERVTVRHARAAGARGGCRRPPPGDGLWAVLHRDLAARAGGPR